MTRLLVIAVIMAVAIIAIRRPAPGPPALSAAATPAFHTAASRSGKGTAVVVYVVGAVQHAGLYRMRDGSRVDDAVRMAGGFTSDADPAATNLAQRLRDGDEVAVSRIGEAPTVRTHRASTRKVTRKRKAAPAEPASVDINHADAATIASLPSVGAALAQRIVAFRELNGPFVSLDDLADVAGMTASRIDRVAPYVVLR